MFNQNNYVAEQEKKYINTVILLHLDRGEYGYSLQAYRPYKRDEGWIWMDTFFVDYMSYSHYTAIEARTIAQRIAREMKLHLMQSCRDHMKTFRYRT